MKHQYFQNNNIPKKKKLRTSYMYNRRSLFSNNTVRKGKQIVVCTRNILYKSKPSTINSPFSRWSDHIAKIIHQSLQHDKEQVSSEVSEDLIF